MKSFRLAASLAGLAIALCSSGCVNVFASQSTVRWLHRQYGPNLHMHWLGKPADTTHVFVGCGPNKNLVEKLGCHDFDVHLLDLRNHKVLSIDIYHKDYPEFMNYKGRIDGQSNFSALSNDLSGEPDGYYRFVFVNKLSECPAPEHGYKAVDDRVANFVRNNSCIYFTKLPDDYDSTNSLTIQSSDDFSAPLKSTIGGKIKIYQHNIVIAEGVYCSSQSRWTPYEELPPESDCPTSYQLSLEATELIVNAGR